MINNQIYGNLNYKLYKVIFFIGKSFPFPSDNFLKTLPNHL